jgi:hypothetical protein
MIVCVAQDAIQRSEGNEHGSAHKSLLSLSRYTKKNIKHKKASEGKYSKKKELHFVCCVIVSFTLKGQFAVQ